MAFLSVSAAIPTRPKSLMCNADATIFCQHPLKADIYIYNPLMGIAFTRNAQVELPTSKLGHNHSSIGAVVVDVGGWHPHAWQPRAVALLDVVRLHMAKKSQ